MQAESPHAACGLIADFGLSAVSNIYLNFLLLGSKTGLARWRHHSCSEETKRTQHATRAVPPNPSHCALALCRVQFYHVAYFRVRDVVRSVDRVPLVGASRRRVL